MREMRRRFEESQRRAERDMEDLRERQRQTDAQLRRSELLFTGHWGKLVESLPDGRSSWRCGAPGRYPNEHG